MNKYYNRLKFLWFLAFIAGLTFVWQDVEILSGNPFQLNIIHKIISHLIIGLVLFFQVLKKPKIISNRIIIFLIVLCFWYFVTSLWSVYPFWTIYRSFEYLIIIFLAAYTIYFLNDYILLKQWVNIVWSWFGVLIISVYMGLILFPSEAILNVNSVVPIMVQGVFPRLNANSVSHLSGALAIVALSRLLWERKKIYVFLFLAMIITMILSQGRSGLIAFVFSFLILLMLHRKIGFLFAISVLIILSILETQFESYFIEFFRRGQNIETIYSLGGRIYKWEFAYEYIKQNPFKGYGAFAGSRFYIMPEITGILSSSTHSAWIELMVDTGLFGLALFLLLVIKILFNLFKKSIIFPKGQRELFIEATSVFVLILIRSFFTTATVINPYDFAFWVGVVLAASNLRF